MENYKLVLPEHRNQYGYLFGGYLLQWVDEAAWICASLEYPACRFVTVAIDKVEFRKTVRQGAILRFEVKKNTAVYSGLRSFYDDKPNLGNYTDLVDDFTNARFHGGVDARGVASVFPVAGGTPDTPLFDRSFGTTGSDYVYSFTADEIQSLNTYLYDGIVAFGFDPDCHFFNDGVKLRLTTGPATPEPGTLALLGAATLAGLRLARRRRAA